MRTLMIPTYHPGLSRSAISDPTPCKAIHKDVAANPAWPSSRARGTTESGDLVERPPIFPAEATASEFAVDHGLRLPADLSY
jgi:hypothetical protein